MQSLVSKNVRRAEKICHVEIANFWNRTTIQPCNDDLEGLRVIFREVDFLSLAFLKGVPSKRLPEERGMLADKASVDKVCFAVWSKVDRDNL